MIDDAGMTLDKMTREAIAAAVGKNVREAMEMYEEKWLTADELCKQFGMFTKDWLRRYGYKVPRERLEVTDEETGETRGSHWAYPMHRIQRWIQEREHKNIMVNHL